MSDFENASKSTQNTVVAVYAIAAVIALSIALAYLVGAWAGWLLFGLFMAGCAVEAVNIARGEK